MLRKNKEITSSILFFANFLDKIWIDVSNEIKNKDIDEDEKEIIFRSYIQVSWELLVERLVCEDNQFLDVYSEGADLYDLSERITFPETENIIGKVKFVVTKNAKDFINVNSELDKSIFNFDKLVSMEDDYYFNEEPPFNKVLGRNIENDKQSIFKLEDVKFYVVF